MEKLERPIIVPWDFSQVAENAFQHAVNISKAVNREILLLHVVHEERDKDSKAVELKASAEKLGKEYGKKPSFKVVSGSIFHAIGENAKELKAEMIKRIPLIPFCFPLTLNVRTRRRQTGSIIWPGTLGPSLLS